jgi:hypothetical protein
MTLQENLRRSVGCTNLITVCRHKLRRNGASWGYTLAIRRTRCQRNKNQNVSPASESWSIRAATSDLFDAAPAAASTRATMLDAPLPVIGGARPRGRLNRATATAATDRASRPPKAQMAAPGSWLRHAVTIHLATKTLCRFETGGLDAPLRSDNYRWTFLIDCAGGFAAVRTKSAPSNGPSRHGGGGLSAGC